MPILQHMSEWKHVTINNIQGDLLDTHQGPLAPNHINFGLQRAAPQSRCQQPSVNPSRASGFYECQLLLLIGDCRYWVLPSLGVLQLNEFGRSHSCT
jgi:hypothetical protein